MFALGLRKSVSTIDIVGNVWLLCLKQLRFRIWTSRGYVNEP